MFWVVRPSLEAISFTVSSLSLRRKMILLLVSSPRSAKASSVIGLSSLFGSGVSVIVPTKFY